MAYEPSHNSNYVSLKTSAEKNIWLKPMQIHPGPPAKAGGNSDKQDSIQI
jgi:hypothetical protein